VLVARQEKVRLERERVRAERARIELERERHRQEKELEHERERLERLHRETRQQAPQYRQFVILLLGLVITSVCVLELCSVSCMSQHAKLHC